MQSRLGRLQYLQREVAGSATDVEYRPSGWSGTSGAAGDQIEREGGVDGGGLAGLQIGKALYVMIESITDFFYRRLS